MDPRVELSLADRTVRLPGGLEIAYRDDGTGPTLVCLHAVSHGSRDFESLLRLLRSRFRIVVIDWPGHGRSAPDNVPASAVRYESVLADALDVLGLERVTLVGNSIGGAAAIRYAARNAERVATLVVCDSGGLIEPNALTRGFCTAMAWVYARATAGGAGWFDGFYRLQYRLLLPQLPAAEQRARIVAAGRVMAPILEAAWRSFASDANDVRAFIDDVGCPVLLAWARRDPYNPYRMASKALKRFANAETRMFAGGHTPFLERPEEFAAALVEFLAPQPP